MASNGKPSKGNESKADDAVIEAAAAPVEITAQAVKPTPVAAAPAVVVAAASRQPASPAGVAGAFDASFDSSKWTKKSLDMWSENATAFFDFAERVTKAKTIDEVADLQSRFFTERLDTIMRQSSELLALAQDMMNVTVAPFYGVKAA